jgi:hypothetical protein
MTAITLLGMIGTSDIGRTGVGRAEDSRKGSAYTPTAHEERGLDRIEQKAPPRRRRTALAPVISEARANRLATLSVAIPFAAIFVLGCLTL